MTNKQIFKAVASAIYVSSFGNQYQVIFPYYDGELSGPTCSSSPQTYSFAKVYCRERRIYAAALQLIKKQGKEPSEELFYESFTNPEMRHGDWRQRALELASMPSSAL